MNYVYLSQVVFCVSWPIPYKNPLRKLFFNIGFQFNYAEPFALANFYNATYFQNIFNSRDLKMDTNVPLYTEFNENNGKSPFNAMNAVITEDTISSSSTVDNLAHVESRGIGGSNDLVGSDLTAAQLYDSIEDNFME